MVLIRLASMRVSVVLVMLAALVMGMGFLGMGLCSSVLPSVGMDWLDYISNVMIII